MEGYPLGSGKLYPFDKLPKFVQKRITRDREKYNIDRSYPAKKLTEYEGHSRKEWYMHIEVNSVGSNNAIKKAILEVK